MQLERLHSTHISVRTPNTFDDLLTKISSIIIKRDTKMRRALSCWERLAITLRYLASGDSYTSIAASYRAFKSTVSGIIPETCDALWDVLSTKIMPRPSTEDSIKIAKDYSKYWWCPNCVGDEDGKNVLLQAPVNSGSQFYNYKRTFSIVLRAVVDAQYNFV